MRSRQQGSLSMGAAILYEARRALFVLILSLLFAYLLEPAVTFLQQHSRLGKRGVVPIAQPNA